MSDDLPRPDHARNMKLVGHSGIGGRGDGLQVMVHRGFAYVAHPWSQGFSIVDMRDPRRLGEVVFVPAPENSWTIHLQTHDDLLLVVNALDLFADTSTFPDEKSYYTRSIGETVGTAEGGSAKARPWTAGMTVYDISTPDAPRRIGFMPVDGVGVHRIWYVGGRWAYASALIDGFTDYVFITIDMADPTKPQIAGRWWLPGMNLAAGETPTWAAGRRFALHHALVEGDTAYAAWRDHRERRDRPARRGRSLPAAALRTGAGYAAGLSMTSVVAGLATALFTAWHFQQVSPLGLVANLAAMPVVSVAVMPMAVLGALLMPFGLDAVPLWVMGQGIAAMNAIAFWLAERSAFDATGAIPLAAVLVLAVALVVLTMTTSALRWAALPLLGLGVGLLAARDLPDAFVSEDARLVALRLDDGRIAVNRDRPRAFTMQNWRRAFGGGEMLRPRDGEDGFSCEGGLCLARRGDGAALAHAADAATASRACAHAAVIVIDDATARNPCAAGEALVVTARDLARHGSAEIRFSGASATIGFAIAEPYRPWHEHRRFSRAARGLAPWRPREAAQPSSDDQAG